MKKLITHWFIQCLQVNVQTASSPLVCNKSPHPAPFYHTHSSLPSFCVRVWFLVFRLSLHKATAGRQDRVCEPFRILHFQLSSVPSDSCGWLCWGPKFLDGWWPDATLSLLPHGSLQYGSKFHQSRQANKAIGCLLAIKKSHPLWKLLCKSSIPSPLS